MNGCHSSSGSSSPPQDISGIVSEHPDQAGLKSIKDWYAFEQTSQSLLDAVLNAVKQQSAVTEIASSVDQGSNDTAFPALIFSISEFSTSCNEFELGANVACVKTLELHDDTVEALATARGLILSASWDNTVKVTSVMCVCVCVCVCRCFVLFSFFFFCWFWERKRKVEGWTLLSVCIFLSSHVGLGWEF